MNAASAPGLIRARGVRVHNLRNIDVDLPRNRLVVLTGVSGSGKSSLAFDTLFAEGQRRYLESLSTYTRQFLDQLERPDVDEVTGLPPTLSIEQRVGTPQPRSTLATTTETYDYLRLLYARVGQAHCVQCGRPVSRQSSQAIVERVLRLETGRRVMLLAPLVRGKRGAHADVIERIIRAGFVRARIDGELVDLAELPKLNRARRHDIDALIDRLIIKEGLRHRLQESVELALILGDGACIVSEQEGQAWNDHLFSSRMACPVCDLSFPELEPRSFSFNSPHGACPTCQGLGVIPSAGDAGDGQRASRSAELRDTPRRSKASPPVGAAGTSVCPDCQGTRLNAFARGVTVAGLRLTDLTAMDVAHAREQLDSVWRAALARSGGGTVAASGAPDAALRDTHGMANAPDAQQPASVVEAPLASPEDLVIAKVLPDVLSRLRFLQRVGLEYLTLDRPTATLSGGEFQRARLAGCLGAGLLGVCYILDEPTIGLHPRDTQRLLSALRELRDQGNSVLLVEHDLDLIAAADHVVDLGPGAGKDGGQIVAAGTPDEVAASGSPTGVYLARRKGRSTHAPSAGANSTGERPRAEFDPARALCITGAAAHNLQNISVRIPLGGLVCVSGVSGSGKSSLVLETLVPLLAARLSARQARPPRDVTAPAGVVGQLTGGEELERLVQVDQSPLGRSGRSNPATASGVWDGVRRVFARTREARLRGFTSSRFSFNTAGGRCETCRGAGTRKIEMNFLPEMHVRCPTCRGARFNRQTLQVHYRGQSIADVLNLRIDEAVEFFANFAPLQARLRTFVEVGLGYLALGQSSLTLSGGESQRIKLAAELGRPGLGRALFVLDEPTTGLHPLDVERLLQVLRRLIDSGHSVIVIEHGPDVLDAADWIIDLGPEGGDAGGRLVAEGPPAIIAQCAASHTGQALRTYLTRL